MEINGIPLHPLVVHAAVVFTPLAALVGVGYLVPAWRDRLRWPLLILALVSLVSIWAAYFTGENLFDERFEGNVIGDTAAAIEKHEELAETLRLVITAFTVAAVAAFALHAKEGAIRWALGGLVAVLAIASLVYCVLTGDAGAAATWGA